MGVECVYYVTIHTSLTCQLATLGVNFSNLASQSLLQIVLVFIFVLLKTIIFSLMLM